MHYQLQVLDFHILELSAQIRDYVSISGTKNSKVYLGTELMGIVNAFIIRIQLSPPSGQISVLRTRTLDLATMYISLFFYSFVHLLLIFVIDRSEKNRALMTEIHFFLINLAPKPIQNKPTGFVCVYRFFFCWFV